MQPIVMPAVTAFSTFSTRISRSTVLPLASRGLRPGGARALPQRACRTQPADFSTSVLSGGSQARPRQDGEPGLAKAGTFADLDGSRVVAWLWPPGRRRQDHPG